MAIRRERYGKGRFWPNRPLRFCKLFTPIRQLLWAKYPVARFAPFFSAILLRKRTMTRMTMGCLCMLLVLYGSAQTVSGVVKDSLTQAPLVFATVAIQSAGMDSALRSTVTDEKGRFTLVKLPS